ncbi:unnamed protein product, partial [Rotaria socialis]
MSTQHKSRVLRDPANPPLYLSKRARTNWIRNAEKELKNYRYKQQYPPFYIPDHCYRIFRVHKFTKSYPMDYVLEHFKHCCSYSIDTESDCDTYDIALIQIHSIPVELPAIVVLIELNHLPSIDSLLFSQIRLLFDFVFQSRNIIYYWGPLVVELESALPYDIFIFPLG